MSGKDQTKIKFQLIDNLILIPIEINGVTLSFILDSGVSKPILFNMVSSSDSLKLKNVESIQIRGLGDQGFVEALKSTQNYMKIGAASHNNQDVFIISDPSINFTPRMGVPVHGIIGYEIFRDFIVEINYASKFLRLNNPKTFTYKKCNGCETLNLTLVNNKPFIDVMVAINAQEIPVTLLIDSGGSDALWLFEDPTLGLIPEKDAYFNDFLGKGLSGSILGKRSKLERFSINKFHLQNVNVAYPDSAAVSFARKYKKRSGSMAGELLRRFNIIMDYTNGKVTFKKNSHFNDSFEYNKSGIVLEQDGVRVIKETNVNTQSNADTHGAPYTITAHKNYKFILKPAFHIVELIAGSPAEKIGLKLGDMILSVNNKDIRNFSLQNVNAFFRAENGKRIKLKIERNGVIMNFHFTLESLL